MSKAGPRPVPPPKYQKDGSWEAATRRIYSPWGISTCGASAPCRMSGLPLSRCPIRKACHREQGALRHPGTRTPHRNTKSREIAKTSAQCLTTPVDFRKKDLSPLPHAEIQAALCGETDEIRNVNQGQYAGAREKSDSRPVSRPGPTLRQMPRSGADLRCNRLRWIPCTALPIPSWAK